MMTEEEKSREARRVKLILASLGIAIVGIGISAWLKTGWVGASALTLILNAIFWIYLLRTRDTLVGHLYLFGLAAGFGELLADHWSIVEFDALVYNPGGPYIWTSPLYMPFGWAVTLAQLGLLGLWWARRKGLPTASVAIAVIGGLLIPFYETLAHYADFWHYRNCWRLWAITPYYIIGFEVLIGLLMPALALKIEKARPHAVAVASVLMALWMWGGEILAYHLVGQPPV